jgi:hypothetical protein
VPTLVWTDDLPKARSGQIMRRLLRDIAEGRALGDVTTLRDPDMMAQLEGKIQEEQTQRGDRAEGRPASQERRPSSACSASSAKIPPCTGRAWKPYT